MIREISKMSNLLFGVWVLSIMVAICSFIVTWVTVDVNKDLVAEVVKLKYENKELNWQLDEVGVIKENRCIYD